MSPGAVVGIQMNQGFLGNYARNADCIIINRLVKITSPYPLVVTYVGPNFGDPVLLDSGNYFISLADYELDVTQGATAFAATMFAGVAVREVKSFTTYNPSPTIARYLPGQPCDVLERGSVSVKCNVGTPLAGVNGTGAAGAVYVRVAANGAIPLGVVGGFEAAADGGNTIQLTNCEWATGAMDANKVVELVIKTRNRA